MKDILILGTGSLARAIGYALSALAGPLQICMAGRDLKEASHIASIATARTSCFQSTSQFSADAVVWNELDLEALFKRHAPKIVINTSSLQSAWEFQESFSAWSQLIRQVGYACTIPFQAILSSKAARAIQRLGLKTTFINACYPDAVNALLAAKGLPVLCGIGNIGILHAGISSSRASTELKMLGHHYHLGKTDEKNGFKIWEKGKAVSFPSAALLDIKTAELNHVTGALAARFLSDFLGSEPALHHVPGPLGLEGGFPVQVANQQLRLDLPETISSSEAITLNKHWAYLDGVTIESDGYVKFNNTIATALEGLRNPYSNGFHVDELDTVCQYFIEFREILRKNQEQPCLSF